MYNAPEPENIVDSLSRAMTTSNVRNKILENIYPEAIIDHIDIEDIKKLLAEFTLDKCKVLILGKRLLDGSCPVEFP